jgi:hypothetical protein
MFMRRAADHTGSRGALRMTGLLKEFWLFLKAEKKWWLVPMLIVMGIIGVLVVMAVLFPSAAPFIYTL